ncbi:MAG TPA: hypothetical protein VK498_13000 [Ferruginibacter sp.]|nr:hypothetical protein [Ferruginibacter sp.]
MIALKKNIFSSLMHLFQKSTGSAHVRLSERANEIFKNSQNGNKIIKAIMDNKDKISDGNKIIVETTGDSQHNRISVERVTEKSVTK